MGTNGVPGSITTFEEGDFSSTLGMIPEEVIKVNVPDAQAAHKYQRARIGTDTGPYCTETNSCLTHVYSVMRAGGAEDVPPDSKTRTSMKYLKNLSKGSKENI